MKYKAVIFDLDGTLVDSIEDIADAMNKVLRDQNLPTHNNDAYRLFVGGGISQLVEKALPKGLNKGILYNVCFEGFKMEYNKNYLNKTKLYPGIAALLDELTERNIKLAVLSNKAHEFTSKVVKALFGQWNFETVIGLTDESLKKPNPKTALMISEYIGVKPADILYLGDTGVDMQTAQNAGMIAVGVLWGFRGKKELLESGAKHLIDYPTDLLKLL